MVNMREVGYLQIVNTICAIVLLAPNLGSAANVKFTNLRCTTIDQSVGEFKKCSLKAVNRDIVEMSIHFALGVEVTGNATVLVRFKKRGVNNFQKALYQYKIDLCAFMRNKRRNPWTDLFYSVFDFSKNSNLNHTCPYNHDIIVKGCRLNINPLGVLAISPGEYIFFTSWYLHENLVGNVDVSMMIA